jgi:outer membrane biosynthesis protein TonB
VNPDDVRPVPALLTPFVAVGRELRTIADAPLPLVGGFVGTLLLSGSVALMLLFGSGSEAAAASEATDEFEIEFEPGALTRLGVEPEPIPQKSIHDATHTTDVANPDKVTDDPSTSEPEPDSQEPVVDPKPKTNDQGDVSDQNRPDTNPYDEADNDVPPTGDPLGDAQGWADAVADGDPWATGVMKALNGMSVPGYAGKLPPGKSFQFKLKICKTGKIDSVQVKQSSGVAELDAAIKFELLRLTIPKPPAHVLDEMASPCVTLKYTFAWQQGRVK